MFYATWFDGFLALLSVGIYAGFGASTLRELAHKGLTSRRLARLGSRLGLAIALPVLLSTLSTRSPFAIMRHIYHMGAILAPLVGLSVLYTVHRARKMSPVHLRVVMGVFGALSVALLPLALHMTFVEPFDVRVEQVEVALSAQRSGQKPVRIAVLADVQTPGFGDYEERVLQLVAAQKPDLILLPGDVLQTLHGGGEGFEAKLPEMRRFLNRLEAPYGVFLVSGDVDPDPHALVEGTHVRLIDGEVVHQRVHDRELTLAGVALRYFTPQARRVIGQLEQSPGAQDIRLLLAHRPGVVEVEAPSQPSRIDLTVVGHTHGGQVNIPGLGPLITMTSLPRHIAAGGLHEHAHRRLYLSRGVGMERRDAPRLRFNCPPEITLITLR